MANNEFFSARNMAEIEAFEHQMEQSVSYDAFEVYMADADKAGISEFAVKALVEACGDFALARGSWTIRVTS